MNSQLTAIVVAVVAVTSVSGGAVLFAEPNAGADGAALTDDGAAAAVQASTSTPQSSQANEQSAGSSTETDDASVTSTDDADTRSERNASTETEEAAETDGSAETNGVTQSNDSSTATDGDSTEIVDDPPTADAGSNETVREWVRVTLDASASADAEGGVSYEWQQVDGPAVALHEEETATPNFLAPDVSDRTNLTFEVTVTDEDGATANDTVTVTVRLPKIDHETPLADSLDAAEDGDADAGESGDDGSSASEGGSSGGADSGDASSPDGGDESAETTRDDIATAKFGTEFDGLNAERAGVVEELYLRHSEDDWDVSEVKTRDELARETYDADYDELDLDARVDVQETFDAQFGDVGGEVSKTDISESIWDVSYENLSTESAGRVTELYDRQPLADGEEPFRTRERWAYLLHDTPLGDLTPGERVEVEGAYHDQFAG